MRDGVSDHQMASLSSPISNPEKHFLHCGEETQLTGPLGHAHARICARAHAPSPHSITKTKAKDKIEERAMQRMKTGAVYQCAQPPGTENSGLTSPAGLGLN